jgi:hypothetical protein
VLLTSTRLLVPVLVLALRPLPVAGTTSKYTRSLELVLISSLELFKLQKKFKALEDWNCQVLVPASSCSLVPLLSTTTGNSSRTTSSTSSTCQVAICVTSRSLLVQY